MKRIPVLAAAFLMGLSLHPAGAASESPYFDFVPDEGVFALYAAMNAHGYNHVSNYLGMAPVRKHVRMEINERKDLHDPLRRLAEAVHEIGHTGYPPVWYLLHAEGPPDFGLRKSDSYSRETGQLMILWEEGAPSLAELYRKGEFHALWAAARPEYERAIAEVAPEADRMAALAMDAIGVGAAGEIPHRVTVIPNLLGVYGSGHRFDIDGRPTVVLGPQIDPDAGVPVRALLEVVVREAIEDHLLTIREKRDLYEMVRDLPRIETATRNFRDLVTECIVQVVWVQVSGQDARWMGAELDRLYAEGYILVKAFQEPLGLGGFRSPSEMVGRVLDVVDVGLETARWNDSERERKIWIDVMQADLDRRQGRVSDAGILYAEILETEPDHPRALYGYGSLLFTQQNYDQAKTVLEEAIRQRADERWVEAWSWIRIGWIEDLTGHRDAALDAYRRAIETGDNHLNAQGVARQGLEKPFGKKR